MKKVEKDRDWFLARIALALGRAQFDVEESDAIMAWITAEHPSDRGGACQSCNGTGKQTPMSVSDAQEVADFASDRMQLVQGICSACDGSGRNN